MVSRGKMWQRVEQEHLSTKWLHEGGIGDDGIVMYPDFNCGYTNPHMC